MTLPRLILREIRHRKLNFALSACGAAFAVLAFALSLAALREHDAETERIAAGIEGETKAAMAAHEDDMRKSMKGLGFNIYIYPQDQDLGEVYAEGFASKTMPEDYVTRLAQSKIVTVNHLLPSLTRKVTWEEKQRTIVLMGVRGEVPFLHGKPKPPLLDPVAPGKVVLGAEIGAGLAKGESVALNGREFEIAEIYAPRGSRDDITAWINLGECQEMLALPGEINAILALECNCATVDRLGEIRAELHQILPDTQIIETESTALARAEARNAAKILGQERLAKARADRAALKGERENLAAALLPAAALASMAWIGLLAFGNVRDRLPEIGILRALGVKSRGILGAFLARAVVAGLLGGWLAAGIAFALPRLGIAAPDAASAVRGNEWLTILAAAPILAAMAAWLPAQSAAGRDPAGILRAD